jgi:hypothetical protein
MKITSVIPTVHRNHERNLQARHYIPSDTAGITVVVAQVFILESIGAFTLPGLKIVRVL